MIRPIVLISSCLLMTGCGLFVPDVEDLQFVRVEPVKFGDLDIHDNLWGKPKLTSDYVLGKIQFSTQSDIREIGERSGLNIWHELTICKTGARVIDWLGLYYRGVDINPNSTTDELQSLYQTRVAAHQPDEPYVYEIYFDPRSTLSRTKGIGQPTLYEPYDFTTEAVELCFQIGGGNMIGGYFKSNIVKVPGAHIATAIGKTGH